MFGRRDLHRFLVNASRNKTGSFEIKQIRIITEGDGTFCIVRTNDERIGYWEFVVSSCDDRIATNTFKAFPAFEALGRRIDERASSPTAENLMSVSVQKLSNGGKMVAFNMEFRLPDLLVDESESYESLEKRFWAEFEAFYAVCHEALFDLMNFQLLESMKCEEMFTA